MGKLLTQDDQRLCISSNGCWRGAPERLHERFSSRASRARQLRRDCRRQELALTVAHPLRSMIQAGLLPPRRSLFCRPPCHHGMQLRASSGLHARRALHPYRTLTWASAGGSQPGPVDGDSEVSPAPTPPAPGYVSKLDTIPPEKLKELRRMGLAMKDRINMGRRGVAPGFVSQIYTRWNTSEVAKLYCTGKHAANFKVLTQQLEERTGGTVVHKAGGSVFLYRGEPWLRDPPAMPAAPGEEEGEESGGGSASTSAEGSQPGPAGGGSKASKTARPPAARYVSKVGTVAPEKLKELRTMGLAMEDRILMGSRGVSEVFVIQIYDRWRKSELAKLYCKGKHAANNNLLKQQLEERTGGIVVHKAGGSVFLYRGEPWPRDPPAMPAAPGEDEGEESDSGAAAAAIKKKQGAARAANRRAGGPPPGTAEARHGVSRAANRRSREPAPGTAGPGQGAPRTFRFNQRSRELPPDMAGAGQGQ